MKSIINKKKLKNIGERYGLKYIILYGSCATGKMREESDIDIAVLGEKEVQLEKLIQLQSEIKRTVSEHHLRRDMDVKSLHCTDPLFRYEVVHDGKLLFGNTTDYENYMYAIFRMYDDAKPLFDLERTLSRRLQERLIQ